MPHLDDITLRVLKTLENHRHLDVLQVASLCEISVSAANDALGELESLGLVRVTRHDHDSVYSLDERELGKMVANAA